MSANTYPSDADPIAAQLRLFASEHGARAETVEQLWFELDRAGVRHPGLAFAGWAETLAVLGGLLTPVLANCPDVATLLADLEQFHPLFNHARITLTRRGNSAALGLLSLTGEPAHPDTVDACFALLSRLIRRLAGPSATPTVVCLRRSEPVEAHDYRVVHDQVVYGQSTDRCVFGARGLTTPIAGADPTVRSLLRPYVDHRTRRRNRPWTSAVAALLTDAPVALPVAARQLMVSPRTLQTRLAAEGQTYTDLLNVRQRDLALALLADPHQPISTVAGQAGFATPSAFTRAMRRWTGLTPSQYRTSMLPANDPC